jgi:hypothetical protein
MSPATMTDRLQNNPPINAIDDEWCAGGVGIQVELIRGEFLTLIGPTSAESLGGRESA